MGRRAAVLDLGTQDLFRVQRPAGKAEGHPIGAGAWLLPGLALPVGRELIAGIHEVAGDAGWRNMLTPGGHRMSVAMTNCGQAGWVSDRAGYRYSTTDPATGRRWPRMPAAFLGIARHAARVCGFCVLDPDACLVNRYVPGARLTLHQDRNEHDFSQPIVSVSLGLPAVFLFGGPKRSDRAQRIAVTHGDVVVWGGPSRLAYHGVAPLANGVHPLTGTFRYNLTFRRAL